MEAIGVRELRREASRWLARVRAGEAFVITDRGRPIARLCPIPQVGGYAQLVADGRLVPGSHRGLDTILDEMDSQLPAADEPPLSEALEELRASER